MEVIISEKGARYHRDESCPGYQQGVNNSEALNRQVHGTRTVEESEAKRLGKLPCKRCSRKYPLKEEE